MNYVFRPGMNYPIPAETVADELESIRARGTLTAPAVVDAARPKDAPLHPCFEWNNPTAAEKYREYQARKLIRSVRVIQEGKTEPEPVFLHVRVDGERSGHYQSTQIALTRPDEWAMAVAGITAKLLAIEKEIAVLTRMAGEQEDEKPAW